MLDRRHCDAIGFASSRTTFYVTPFGIVNISNARENRRRPAGIAFILLTVFIDILGVGIIIPVLPELVKELIGGDEAAAGPYVGVIAATYSLMQFIFAPILGLLSDRFGRRPILLLSLFGLGVDFIIQGLSTNIAWLFVGRLIAGMMGASITTANAYIADVSDDETRARNFGLIGVMFGLGFIFGPSLGGLLGGIGLRVPFFAAAALALVNWLYGYFILPESLPPEKRRPTPLSLSAISPWSVVKRLRRYPIIGGLALVYGLKGFAQRGLETTWVLYTAAKFDWSEWTNGLSLGWVGVSALVIQGGMVRPFVKRFGERKTVMIGIIVSSIAFAAYAFVPVGWMVPLIIPFGAMGGLTGPAIQSIVTKQAGDGEQGEIQGALTSVNSLCSVAAPLFFTAFLFTVFNRSDAPIQFPGAPLLAGSVLIFSSLIVAMVVFKKFPEER